MLYSVQVEERTAGNTNPPQHLDTDKNNTEFEVGENVVALFTEGIYPGEIIEINGDFLGLELYAKVGSASSSSVWKMPSLEKRERQKVHKLSILPIRPVFGVNQYSTHRIVMYDLLNAELIDKFA